MKTIVNACLAVAALAVGYFISVVVYALVQFTTNLVFGTSLSLNIWIMGLILLILEIVVRVVIFMMRR